MERNEGGHDSPVFEAVSGLKLSSHLKCYPSSGRGRLTHTAHIKAPFLYTHTHTHTHTLTNKQTYQNYTHMTLGTLLRNTHCVSPRTQSIKDSLTVSLVSLRSSITIILPECCGKSQLCTKVAILVLKANVRHSQCMPAEQQYSPGW